MLSFTVRNGVQVGRVVIPGEGITVDRYIYCGAFTEISFAVIRKHSKLDIAEGHFDNPKEEYSCPDWPNSVASEISDILDKKLKYVNGDYIVVSASGVSKTRDFYEAWDKLR